uniref:Uncharacterized protein n=1 Tax=Solanum lycopersicum TaxID=4081 RepID=A0A3Q7H795_SOLLC
MLNCSNSSMGNGEAVDVKGKGTVSISTISGTNKFRIFFSRSSKLTMNLIEYSNIDWASGVDDSRSTSEYLFVWVQVFLVGALKNKKLQVNQ